VIVFLLLCAAIALVLYAALIAIEAVRPPRRGAGYAAAFGLPMDPSELIGPNGRGFAFESWTLDRPDGAALPVWDIALGKGEATLIVVHGWGRSRIDSLGRLRAMLDLADGLFGRALLLDLRGHGEATGGGSTLGDGDDADLVELIARAGPAPVVVVGHSMGAVAAIRAAGRSPASLRGIIAFAPYLEVGVPMNGRLEARGWPARPFTDIALLGLRLAGIRRLRTDVAARSMQVPIVVIAGEEDALSPASGAEAIAAAAPRGRFLLVRGAAHADAHALLAEPALAALSAFLRSAVTSPEARAT
jgi:pimeloyl-ACP methyl ester carboxylesterase